MAKIVINDCYGGFRLSEKAIDWLFDNYGICYETSPLPRHDPYLVECVETLGKDASSEYSNLVIRTISGNKYRICEYDGAEWVETPDSIQWTEISK